MPDQVRLTGVAIVAPDLSRPPSDDNPWYVVRSDDVSLGVVREGTEVTEEPSDNPWPTFTFRASRVAHAGGGGADARDV